MKFKRQIHEFSSPESRNIHSVDIGPMKNWQREDRSYRFVQQMLDTICGATQLSMGETDFFRNNWRKLFMPADPENQEIPHHSCPHCPERRYSYDWFYFSSNRFPPEKDIVGRIRQGSHPMERVVVWIELCNKPAIELRAGELADFLEKNKPPLEELYIASRKNSWAAIYTHEDDIGPYFLTRKID
jgi:hypothetical protein